jgi:hypothetical protein
MERRSFGDCLSANGVVRRARHLSSGCRLLREALLLVAACAPARIWDPVGGRKILCQTDRGASRSQRPWGVLAAVTARSLRQNPANLVIELAGIPACIVV